MGSIGSGKVRVVVRIRGSSDENSEDFPVSKSSILVSRPGLKSSSSRVKVSFSSDQITSGKQSYEVDECYEEEVGNEELFIKEIKPLISGLFEGQNATVFAYGSRGSGKTYTVQGFEGEFGLVAFTMDLILPRAKETGKVVNVSVFEVCQDRITDLFDSKLSEVVVLEDATGKIKLKGLSKVKVNSTEDFQRLYHDAVNTRMQKAAEPPHRSHIGCILHVVSPQTENSKAKLVGKINFIDLASYEDSRKSSSDGLNLTNTATIKKSLTALHNVLYALNAKERVPYRESKLTRMLQDSLGGSSQTLMITCINPSFCQGTVQTISISSRSCVAAGVSPCIDPVKSGRSSTRPTGMFSPQIAISASKLSVRTNLMASPQILKSASKPSTQKKLMSSKVLKPASSSASARKHPTSHLSVKKASGGVAVQKTERKLFVDAKKGKSLIRENVCTTPAASLDSSAKTVVKGTVESEETVKVSTQLEEKSTENALSETVSSPLAEKEKFTEHVHSGTYSSSPPLSENETSNVSSDVNSSQIILEEETTNVSSDVNSSQTITEEDIIQAENKSTATPCAFKTPTGSYLAEDRFNDGQSPPLSARLRDLSNNLKSLCFSTEAKLKMTQETSRFANQVNNENSETKTPASQLISGRASEIYTQETSRFCNQVNNENSETKTPASQLISGRASEIYTQDSSRFCNQVINENLEPKTPATQQLTARASGKYSQTNNASPWTTTKDSLVKESLKFLNSASKEELKGLKGIGEKRSTYILELRDESPEPFKELDDLKDIGLSEKQIKQLMKNVAGNLFS